jgi:hypothetical protein
MATVGDFASAREEFSLFLREHPETYGNPNWKHFMKDLSKFKRFFPQRSVTDFLFRRYRKKKEKKIYTQILSSDEYAMSHKEIVAKVQKYVDDVKMRKSKAYRTYSLPTRSQIKSIINQLWVKTVPDMSDKEVADLEDENPKRGLRDTPDICAKDKYADEELQVNSKIPSKDEGLCKYQDQRDEELIGEEEERNLFELFQIVMRMNVEGRRVPLSSLFPYRHYLDGYTLTMVLNVYKMQELLAAGIVSLELLRAGIEPNPGPRRVELVTVLDVDGDALDYNLMSFSSWADEDETSARLVQIELRIETQSTSVELQLFKYTGQFNVSEGRRIIYGTDLPPLEFMEAFETTRESTGLINLHIDFETAEDNVVQIYRQFEIFDFSYYSDRNVDHIVGEYNTTYYGKILPEDNPDC